MRKITTIIALLFLVNIYSQMPPDSNGLIKKYTMSAPDIYNFEKYSLSTVNNYVGKPQISVPIYTIKTGNIEYPVDLAYDAGGIKVDQIASNVGLGWNLTSTILTRTINQDNDFDNTGCLSLQTDSNTYSLADQDADYNARSDYHSKGKMGYFLQKQLNAKISSRHTQVDFIPDVYHFYTNGFSTDFFFLDENTPVEINPKGTIIQALKSKQRFPTGRTTGGGTLEYTLLTQDFFTIIITTSQGIKYTFSDCNLASNQKISSTFQSAIDLINVHEPAQISSWNITKIDDLNTNKKIDFFYTNTSSNPNPITYNSPFRKMAQRSFEYTVNPDFVTDPYIPPACGYLVEDQRYQNTGYHNYSIDEYARIDVVKKRLTQIVFDEGFVRFNYGGEDMANQQSSGPRLDLYGEEYLSDIEIYNKAGISGLVKKFHLGYEYFTSNYNIGEFNPDGVFNDYRYKRLKLKNVNEIGKPTYKFTYEESIKLPPINSFSVDFLGYYNNSPDATSVAIMNTNGPKPTLYHLPNNFEKSLLPFPVSGLSATTIPGYFNRQANNFSKAWSLTKIEYPSGGSSEYIYESNQFEEFGQNILGGGIRILQQKLNDDNGNIRIMNYSYLKNGSSITSGKLSSFPYFGHPVLKAFNVDIDYSQNPIAITSPAPILITDLVHWKLFGKSNLNEDITSGAFVGYSRVEVSEIGKGKSEFKFTSNESIGFSNKVLRLHPLEVPTLISGHSDSYCLSDFMIANSGLGANIFTDNSYKRGKLLEEKIYNESNQLLKQKNINYLDNLTNTFTFYQPFTKTWCNCDDRYGENFVNLLTSRKDFKIAQFLKSNETTKTFDGFGNFIAETTNYTYNTAGFLKTIENLSSNGDTNKTEFNYPTEVTTSLNSLPGFQMGFSDNYFYRNFTFTHRKNDVIQTNYYKNSILNSYVRKIFEIYSPLTNYDNFISPRGVIFGKQNGETQKSLIITKTDIDYNPTEFYSQNGQTISVIWGYNKTKIIAKIENLELPNISTTTISNLQTLSNADFDSCKLPTCNEQLLRNALNTLRTTIKGNYPNAIVTTFTFDPLVGVTSVTDSKEDIQYYIYDDLERLLRVEDKQGNILSENEYKYKN